MTAICVANNKGGVGKTTTAVNLAAGLARLNFRVLVVDVDGQANATYALTGRVHPVPSLYDVLVGDRKLETVLWKTNEENVWIVPGDGRLQNADVEMASRPGREWRLAKALYGQDFDYIILDTPPSLGVLTQNALAAAHRVLIPISLTEFSLIGMDKLEATIEDLRDQLDLYDLEIAGVVATFYENTTTANETWGILEKKFEGRMLETHIPKNLDLEKAHRENESILSFAPNSSGGQAYMQLAREVKRLVPAHTRPYDRRRSTHSA
ncbi:MAG: Chromosome (plasmid) partitioning protein ParA [Ktedonobacterales bacterium]|jgi:chromosome partitioning protein|nr:MAG: Chromosome (plasmid) partitioning protein ParA [Ktedonobacterales bacterium]